MEPGVRSRLVRDTVRRWVLQQDVAPGCFLDEAAIAARLGCDRAEVHDALRDLADEGIVVLSPVQGALVNLPSEVALTECAEVGEELWALTVRRFVGRASDSQVQALAAAARRFRDAAETDPRPEELLRARDWFYRLLLRVGAGPATRQLIDDWRPGVGLALVAGLVEPGRALVMADELDEICAGVLARDAATAAAACARHVAQSARTGIRRFAVA